MRGRAIHIHDELVYADVSSYWGMYQAWDSLAERGNCGEDCLVQFNRARGSVSITGLGYAIGHYARWIGRGAVRVGAGSDDPLLLVSAFRDDARGRIVAVLVNNHREPVAMSLAAGGVPRISGVRAEQSSAQGFWLPVDGAIVGGDGRIDLILPGRSVTSLSAGWR